MNYQRNQQAPQLLQQCRQVLKCPKCEIGVFIPSEDVDIHYVCNNCGHTLWNGPPKEKDIHT